VRRFLASPPSICSSKNPPFQPFQSLFSFFSASSSPLFSLFLVSPREDFVMAPIYFYITIADPPTYQPRVRPPFGNYWSDDDWIGNVPSTDFLSLAPANAQPPEQGRYRQRQLPLRSYSSRRHAQASFVLASLLVKHRQASLFPLKIGKLFFQLSLEAPDHPILYKLMPSPEGRLCSFGGSAEIAKHRDRH